MKDLERQIYNDIKKSYRDFYESETSKEYTLEENELSDNDVVLEGHARLASLIALGAAINNAI